MEFLCVPATRRFNPPDQLGLISLTSLGQPRRKLLIFLTD